MMVFYVEELLASHWLSTTAFSVYSQLPSMPEGHLLHPQPADAPCHGDKGAT